MPKTHRRVPLATLHATPANGLYLTRADAAKYALCTGGLLCLLVLAALLPAKTRI